MRDLFPVFTSFLGSLTRSKGDQGAEQNEYYELRALVGAVYSKGRSRGLY